MRSNDPRSAHILGEGLSASDEGRDIGSIRAT
ncbi:hypothetical protein RS9916_33607 [Synechococcus sp. RS9916]|nr:hypothetical protein RS9916_33607 [Synechococcus sp. RS9916]